MSSVKTEDRKSIFIFMKTFKCVVYCRDAKGNLSYLVIRFSPFLSVLPRIPMMLWKEAKISSKSGIGEKEEEEEGEEEEEEE